MKKLKKDALGLTKASLITSVGASAVSGAGGNVRGLSTLSSSFPTVGATVGASASMRMLKKMSRKKKR